MTSLSPLIRSFVAHFGEMGSRWGINRTVGQIYALMFVAPAPLDADGIAEKLEFSRSNVSMGSRNRRRGGCSTCGISRATGANTAGPPCWLPCMLSILVFVLGFLGLAYSIYPFEVMGRMSIRQAGSAPEALKVILCGVCISAPAIAGYTVFSYRVFRGKTGELKYA